MRVVSYLLASLVLASFLVSAAEAPESYTIVHQNEDVTIGVDKSYLVFHKDRQQANGLPALELKVELTYAKERNINGAVVRRFRNTIVADCAGDRLAVIASKAFNAKGKEVVIEGAGPVLMENPNDANSIVTVMLDGVICPAYATALKSYKGK